MIVQTKQQRKNTLEALNVMWPSVPPGNVLDGLFPWRDPHSQGAVMHCGSLGCFGGWCSAWPNFVAQGLWADSWGSPKIKTESGTYSAKVLFGSPDMFCARGNFELTDFGFTGTDHELVTHRLKWLLENSKVSA